jgi:adenylate cyclase
LVGCALIGLVFGGAVGGAVFQPASLGAIFGGLAGAIYCAALMVLIGGAEMFLPRTRFGQALERSPLLVAVGAKAVAYSAVIIVIVGGRLGLRASASVAAMAGQADFALRFAQEARATIPGAVMIATAILLVICFLLLRELNHLVGNRTFRAIALGRYHQPRVEERFFLFVDIVGSTSLAERLGPTSVHAFLDRVFQIASDPIDDHDGEVYQYVGDEMVITWTVREGRRGARPLACLFALEEALKLAAPDFEREFGAAPRLRAALHAGPVTTGEVGGSRRAIVFHGDVMNTASRLENATRELDRPFLASEDALSRLEGIDAYALVDLGSLQLRGRAAPVRVYAVVGRHEARDASAL